MKNFFLLALLPNDLTLEATQDFSFASVSLDMKTFAIQESTLIEAILTPHK
jgi:hypothetical protein